MDPEIQNQQQDSMSSSKEAIQTSKPSRWIGIIAIALFVLLGGMSDCPWYLWIVLIILGLLTYAGSSKWWQLTLGLILLIWGASDNDDAEYVSGQQNYQTESSSKSYGQSESERKYIENKLWFIEQQKTRFNHAVEIGDIRESQRISDDMWAIKQELEEMNLTPEQRRRLSRLFAI